jgi:hypothetical protein
MRFYVPRQWYLSLKYIKKKSIINKYEIIKKKKKVKRKKIIVLMQWRKKIEKTFQIDFLRIINFKKVNCQKEQKKFIKST